MLERLLGGDALCWIVYQQTFDQVLRVRGHLAPVFVSESEFAVKYSLEDHFIVRPVERRVAAEQDVHDNAARPDVALLVVVSLEHFWSDIIRLMLGVSTVPSFFFSLVPLSK